jgi:hypothetical protein
MPDRLCQKGCHPVQDLMNIGHYYKYGINIGHEYKFWLAEKPISMVV